MQFNSSYFQFWFFHWWWKLLQFQIITTWLDFRVFLTHQHTHVAVHFKMRCIRVHQGLHVHLLHMGNPGKLFFISSQDFMAEYLNRTPRFSYLLLQFINQFYLLWVYKAQFAKLTYKFKRITWLLILNLLWNPNKYNFCFEFIIHNVLLIGWLLMLFVFSWVYNPKCVTHKLIEYTANFGLFSWIASL